MKLLDIILEALSQAMAEPYLKIQRDPEVIKQMDAVFDEIKKMFPKHHESDETSKDAFPSFVSSKSGDRLYIPFKASEDSDEDVKSEIRDDISDALIEKGYQIKDYKKGIAFDPKNNQQIKIGKILARFDLKDLLNKFNADPVRSSSRADDLMIVFSKHPYDIAGMSTDRSWTSCQNIDPSQKGLYSDKVYCGVEEGTIVIYLIYGDDFAIERPIARSLGKQYKNNDEPYDTIYVASGVYGNAPPNFLPYLKEIFNNINIDRQGTYNYKSKLYNDEKATITKYNLDAIAKDLNLLDKYKLNLKPEEIVYIVIKNKHAINHLYDETFTEDHIKTMLKSDPNFFEQKIYGMTILEMLNGGSLASYYNVMLNKPDYFSHIMPFGGDNITKAYLGGDIPIFINRNGDPDITGVKLDNTERHDRFDVIGRAAYYNVLLGVTKFKNFRDFGFYGGDIAYVWMLEEDGTEKSEFINRNFEPDVRGVDPFKIEAPGILTNYFNQKLNTKLFEFVYIVDIENYEPLFLVFKNNPGASDYLKYLMNKDGNPDVTGITGDGLSDLYNERIEIRGKKNFLSATQFSDIIMNTREMIRQRQENTLSEIRNNFNRFLKYL